LSGNCWLFSLRLAGRWCWVWDRHLDERGPRFWGVFYVPFLLG
jgi:hypothetical protein